MRLGLALALALGALGCGEDSENGGNVSVEGGTTGTARTQTTPTTLEGKPVQTVRISETDFALSPKKPKVAKFGVVTFEVTNEGETVHALEVEGPKGEVETDEIKPGESATLKADLSKAGRYKLYCPVGDHEARGMKAEVVVAGGGERGGAVGGDGHGGY